MVSAKEMRTVQAQLRREGRSDSDTSELSVADTDIVTGANRGPGERQSSINTEPLTLNEEQMADAKQGAEDVMRQTNNEPLDFFTQDVDCELAIDKAEDVETVAAHIHELLDKAQQVVDANDKQSEIRGRVSGNADISSDESPSEILSKSNGASDGTQVSELSESKTSVEMNSSPKTNESLEQTPPSELSAKMPTSSAGN